MKISNGVYTQNFGRAFTPREKREYKNLIKDAEKALGLKETEAVVFDFNVPSENGFNPGIGSSHSENMIKFAEFLKDMTGITAVQAGPQGKLEKGIVSPYSGASFAYGEHTIDFRRLTLPQYACILEDSDIHEADENYKGDKNIREYRTDYEAALGAPGNKGVFDILLKQAYMNYIFGMTIYDEPACRLDLEFQDFKEENKEWLDKETTFAVLSNIYGTDDFNEWDERDRNLYSDFTPPEERERRIKRLKKDYIDKYQYESFKQFLADKQHKETRAELNGKGIKLYGDCPLGFSKSEVWGNIDCFSENLYYGSPDDKCGDGVQKWGLRAPDYMQTGVCRSEWDDISSLGKTGKLLYDKFYTLFSRYDGLRMNAAWQFVTPFMYEETDWGIQEVQMPSIGETVFNIMNKAAADVYGSKFNSSAPDNIMLDLSGVYAGAAREMTKNIYPHVYSTEYAQFGETPAQFKKHGYENGRFITGAASHDNEPLVKQSLNKEVRNLQIRAIESDYGIKADDAGYQCREYTDLDPEKKAQESFRNAKFAEIFTSAKQFFTLPDMFGMSERINIPGKESDDNWRVRIPKNYEEFYYSQLSKGFGLNVPKALETAFKMLKINNPKITEKLAEAAEILRQDGPVTTHAAARADSSGKIKNKFRYKA